MYRYKMSVSLSFGERSPQNVTRFKRHFAK
jgi:hypothetical protein